MMVTATAGIRPSRLENLAFVLMLGFAASTQFSIAAADSLLGATAALWIALLVRDRELPEVPRMFWPLAAYAAVTLIAAAFSIAPDVSFWDSKQLLVFSIVPISYRLFRGRRSLTVVDVVITVGALHAVYGVIQFGILNYDNLGQRVQGLLGHYMTYSGVIMLVACTAVARIMFRRQDRTWTAAVLPALLVALALTMSRNAWVGACAGIGLLFLLRDFRLVALLPVVAAVFLAFAPAPVSERLYSTFSLSDPSNRDRLAMIRSGLRIIKDDPLTGVGPDAVRLVYPHYRDPAAEKQLNPHLHNVPLQIAAERGIPALVIWLWFVVTLTRDFVRQRRSSQVPSLPTAALAGVVAMFAAGMFEYNFGDSEFLMLFLLLMTLPYAADRLPASTAPAVTRQQRAA
jgi:putative inorganic carbon (HCO3(-)) transporter